MKWLRLHQGAEKSQKQPRRPAAGRIVTANALADSWM